MLVTRDGKQRHVHEVQAVQGIDWLLKPTMRTLTNRRLRGLIAPRVLASRRGGLSTTGTALRRHFFGHSKHLKLEQSG